MTVQLIDTRLAQHYHIEAPDYILMQAKTLSDLPLDQITADSPFDMLS
jgi:hypothetical protein